ncbi:hypothetical protein HOS87_gp11 [Pseudomonas phage phiNV3]|uniref:Uncharacterized protein n=1 Tax=Pseudomonas phage phiNV3 TaxID=2079544 RepID=A0A2P0ZLK1_9CAUD|nr:hypothetical protein [Pseudomonas tolaasii]YP_009798991.1 hypothetical protein HOS87_gp11 [Pseudomonas phage phiNV3]ARB30322.1 hypothetical protein B5P22_24550 [Pseudomonas tolaasii]AVH86121.1 hypothetical protein phiNV3_p11 [Pseudomonas phage phiNV3]
MAKQNRMHIVALQTTLGRLTSEKLALQAALDALGYCHEQQTKFITDSMSGADGAISQTLLLQESKAALAEAIQTNKRLTEDAEFQAYRHQVQAQRLAQTARCCRELGDKLAAAYSETYTAHKWLCAAGLVLFTGLLGTAVHVLGAVL